jgi:hypothetical protein
MNVLGNKKHQGKPSLVCLYVLPQATTAFDSGATCDANETESMFSTSILTQPQS